MNRVIKLSCVIFAVTIGVSLITSCLMLRPFEYSGEYPELWSTAVRSIPSATGIGFNGTQPGIEVIETDQYGRVLFRYGEGLPPVFRVIMQRSDDNYAYFYPHYNHMTFPRVGTGYSAIQAQRDLYNEMIEDLKIANNWNQPLSDDSEFDRVRIVRRRVRGPVPEGALREAFHELLIYAGRDSIPSWDSGRMLFLREDRYGRAIYEHSWGDQKWIVIFQPDHSFDINISFGELIGDDYQTDLRLLMEANGWNTPP